MSALRTLRRGLRYRCLNGSFIPVPPPNARMDAVVRVHPVIDALITDEELARARYRVPYDVARSRTKRREWESRIMRRLAVPESTRRMFAAGGAR